MKTIAFLMLASVLALGQNPNTAIFPGGDATDANLFVAANSGRTTLVSSITSSATSIVLASGTNFTAPVIIQIGLEIIHCTTKTTNTLSGCTRPSEGTTAAMHFAGSTVTNIISAWHHNQVAAEIKAIEACLTNGTSPCSSGANPVGSNGDLQMKNGTALAASHANDTGSVLNITEPLCVSSSTCADTSGLGGTASWGALKSGTCTGTMSGSDGAIRDCAGVPTWVGASSSAFILSGGPGGTPSSLTLTNAIGLPIGGLTGLATGIGTALATTPQGNATKFQMASGAATSGHCAQFDASGNLVDSGAPCSGGGGSCAGYTHHATAVVAAAQVTGTLTNWPGVVTLSNTTLKVAGFGGSIQHTVTQTVGTRTMTVPADFYVTSDAGCATQITGVEFDAYDGTAGTATLWTKPASVAVGTTIYLWWGNAAVSTLQGTPSAVWDASTYAGVYHFGDATTLSLSDSTSHANNGTGVVGPNGNLPFAIAGKIAGALNSDFNGGTGYNGGHVTLPANMFGSGNVAIESWVYGIDGGGAWTRGPFIMAETGTSDEFAMAAADAVIETGPSIWGGSYYGGRAVSANGLVNGTWYHVVVTGVPSGLVTTYVNGAASGSTASTYFATYGVAPAMLYDPLFGFTKNGSLDESRLMNVAPSAAWIAADYNNQSAPGSFWTVSYF